MQDPSAFRAEWRLVRGTATFPDRLGLVRNVEVRVVPSQDGSPKYKLVQANYLKRHVSNLVVIVPFDDYEHYDAEEKKNSDGNEGIAKKSGENEVETVDVDPSVNKVDENVNEIEEIEANL